MKHTAPLALLALVAVTTASNPSPTRTSAQAHVVQHLNGALDLLSERDLSSLTSTQLANRATLIETLIRYRDAGAFPENHDFAHEYVPYFVDQRSGALCAVGHLMNATGHGALVERIAQADNHVRVMDLANDAEVGAWLDTYGLTLAEAARIQPWYAPVPPGAPYEAPATLIPVDATKGLAIASGVLSVLTIAPPSPRFRSATSLLGFVSSVGAIVGGTDSNLRNQNSDLAFRSTLIGAVGVGVSAISWYAAARNAPTRSESRWRIIPATNGRQFSLSFQRR
jgi:hypothetical protein